MTYKIYLSLGTNQGDKINSLRIAIKKLRKHINIASISSFYETDPVGDNATEKFINIVLEATTKLIPQQLLREINKIENSIGRRRSKELHWGDRVIDIDIIHYEGIMMNDYKLTIPHKELFNRIFVILPLLEISPEMIINNVFMQSALLKAQEKNKNYKIKKMDIDE